MTILGEKIEDAVEKGLAIQVVLADPDGFVLDNDGYVYDPDELVSVFMSTQQQMSDGVLRFDFGQISEFSFRLVGTDTTIACRRVFWPDGGCLVVVVVPAGATPNLIIADAIRSYKRYLDGHRKALRDA
ncbi:MAG: hypothetical protein RDU20_04560 [Desulfomonilaceae bacterium]|nr:hypothetical protein [Desulfomonilaceae bacterium]